MFRTRAPCRPAGRRPPCGADKGTNTSMEQLQHAHTHARTHARTHTHARIHTLSLRETDRQTETERQRQRDRERQIQKETDRETDRETETETRRLRQTEIEGDREGEREPNPQFPLPSEDTARECYASLIRGSSNSPSGILTVLAIRKLPLRMTQ